jgi:hypothetical protein
VDAAFEFMDKAVPFWHGEGKKKMYFQIQEVKGLSLYHRREDMRLKPMIAKCPNHTKTQNCIRIRFRASAFFRISASRLSDFIFPGS